MNKVLAKVWLLAVLGMALAVIALWRAGAPAFDSDIQSLLPQQERDAVVELATERMARSGARRVVALLAGPDWEATRRAAAAYEGALAGSPLTPAVGGDARELMQFYQQHRLALLSPDERRALREQPPQYWLDRATRLLFNPVRAGLGWRDDPFGAFGGWLLERAHETRVRALDGRLAVEDAGRRYAVVSMTLEGSAFSMSDQAAAAEALERAEGAARSAVPGIEVIKAGVVLHAQAASARARQETSTIGLGGLLGVVVVLLLVFRKLSPLLLAGASMAAGTLAAFLACTLLFDRLNLLTLVFGASLVGVAVDYSIHPLCDSIGNSRPGRERMRRLLPGLFLAMFTSVIAYVGLALTPFPGLRQMATFAVVGLVAAWLSVVLWYPWFADASQPGAVASWIAGTRQRWPVVGRNQFTAGLVVVVLALIVTGAREMHVQDDIRALHQPSPALAAQQQQAARLLGLPSPAQFFVVRGVGPDELLANEEVLTGRLDALVGEGALQGYQAVSNWMPSRARQEENIRLQLNRLYGSPALAAELSRLVGEDIAPAGQDDPRKAVFDAEEWLAAPVSEPLRPLWLGRVGDEWASVVMLQGVTPQVVPQLAALAGGAVRWVDQPAQISEVLAAYRNKMSMVVALSYVAVFVLLLVRYGPDAWRIVVPTLLAGVLTLALVSLLGQPLQIFTVLALFLVLGMGVDYGIFLLEHSESEQGGAWLAITLSAISTALSFGLLSLSDTPVLKTFGLATLIGIALMWVLTPYFCGGRSLVRGAQAVERA